MSKIAVHIGTALRALGPAFGEFVEAAVLIGGAGLIAFGCWEAYRPAGPVVGGVLLIAGTILRARGKV